MTYKSSADIKQQPIAYSGDVSLKFRKGGSVYKTVNLHNSGTMRLFAGLANFIAGAYSALNSKLTGSADIYIPQYLALGKESTTTATNPTATRLYHELNISRFKLDPPTIKVDYATSSYKIIYRTMIDYASVGSNTFSELGLFSTPSNNSETMLARVVTNEVGKTATGETLEVGEEIEIEWVISIQNKI